MIQTKANTVLGHNGLTLGLLVAVGVMMFALAVTTQSIARSSGTDTGKKTRFLVLMLGTLLAAQVVVIPLTQREARAVSTEKIVFESNRTTGQGVNNPTGDYEIFKMNPDGTGVKQLTTNRVNDYRSSLSPGGKKVTYVSGGKQTSKSQGDEDV